MSVRFVCACGQLIVTADEAVGASGRCPLCHRHVQVPERSRGGELRAEADAAPALRFACACGQLVVVPGNEAGRAGECPACGERIRAVARSGPPVAVASIGSAPPADVGEEVGVPRPGGPGQTRPCPLCQEPVHVLASYCLGCNSSILGAARIGRPTPPAELRAELDRALARLGLIAGVAGAALLNPMLSMLAAGCALRSEDRGTVRGLALLFGVAGTVLGCAALVWQH